jgi:hypothetical protein
LGNGPPPTFPVETAPFLNQPGRISIGEPRDRALEARGSTPIISAQNAVSEEPPSFVFLELAVGYARSEQRLEPAPLPDAIQDVRTAAGRQKHRLNVPSSH